MADGFKIEPLFDRVLLKKTMSTDFEPVTDEKGELTGDVRFKDSKLIVPLQSVVDRPDFEVIAIGPACKIVKVGDNVLMDNNSAMSLMTPRDHFIAIEESLVARIIPL